MPTGQPPPTEYERIVAQLAQTLRSERAKRRLSRYELAQRAELSERYLAQLESGLANPSLTVLTRLAEALNLGLLELLDVAALATPTQAEYLIERLQYRLAARHLGIDLVGLRGAGKTTLGQLLAARLGWRFFRLTELITERTQIPLVELFSLGGDAAFRRLELETLQQLIDTSDEQFIIEIGGGLVTNRPAYELLRRHWITVWLSTSPDEHMQRVIAQGDVRPMHGNARAMDELRAILNERTRFYEEAELHLSTSNQRLDTSLNALEELVRQYLANDNSDLHPPTSFEATNANKATTID
jgi:XRE family aerobic/anaerobic benzoate catabolism transcriptional regulator